MTPRHHVIIGDGASAAAFVRGLDLVPGDRLTIIGDHVNQFGRGLAYRDPGEGKPWRDAYLLNSPAGVTDEEFVDWLGANWAAVSARMEGTRPEWLGRNAEAIKALDYGALFPSRAIFGDYLNERAERDLERLYENGIQIDKRRGLATAIAEQLGRFRITLNTGNAITADSVDIATGGAGNQRYGSDTGETAFSQLYGNEEALATIIGRENRPVTVLGANAAMLDVLRFMQSIMDEGDIRLGVISPSGEIPEPLSLARPRRPNIVPNLGGPYVSAAEFLAAVDADIATHRAAGATMAELRGGYYGYLTELGLVDFIGDRAERQKVRNALESRFRRSSTDSIEDFHRLRAAGQIELIAAEVKRVYARDRYENDVKIVTRGGETQEATVPIVINASGPGRQFAFDLLTVEMIRNGWLRFDNNKIGLRVGAELETEVKGVRYLSPAVTEIGTEILPFPLYDIAGLARAVEKADALTRAKKPRKGRKVQNAIRSLTSES